MYGVTYWITEVYKILGGHLYNLGVKTNQEVLHDNNLSSMSIPKINHIYLIIELVKKIWMVNF